MKNILVTSIMLLTFSFSQFRVGYDFNQSMGLSASEMGISIDASVDFEENGISFGYDHFFSELIGLGVEYQLDRDEFSANSVYGVLKYDFAPKFYGFGRAGLNVTNDKDLDGGICWSIGAGVLLNDKIGINALYSWYSLRTIASIDYSYKRISVGITFSPW